MTTPKNLNLLNKLTSGELLESLRALRAGQLILTPTDTIWGLSCDATNQQAVQRLKAVKQRPADKSFIVLMSSQEMLQEYVDSNWVKKSLLQITDRPTTIIYPSVSGIVEQVKANDGSMAIRLPKLDWLQELIEAFGSPIVSTSANISGEPSPTDFTTIHHSIKDAVGYTLPHRLEQTNQPPSRIVKLLEDGEVEIIRK